MTLTMKYRATFYPVTAAVGSAPVAWGDGLSESDAIKDGESMMLLRGLTGRFTRQMHKGEGMGMALYKNELVEFTKQLEEFESEYLCRKS